MRTTVTPFLGDSLTFSPVNNVDISRRQPLDSVGQVAYNLNSEVTAKVSYFKTNIIETIG